MYIFLQEKVSKGCSFEVHIMPDVYIQRAPFVDRAVQCLSSNSNRPKCIFCVNNAPLW